MISPTRSSASSPGSKSAIGCSTRSSGGSSPITNSATQWSALALPGTETVHKVSIIPHGVGALGYTIQRPTEDRYLMTRAELEHKMAALLGGRAAEQLVFREISTGAADDLARATDIARAMVLRYGMSEALGNVAYDRDRSPFLQPNFPMPQERNYSEGTAEAVDGAVRELGRQRLRAGHRDLAAEPRACSTAPRPRCSKPRP